MRGSILGLVHKYQLVLEDICGVESVKYALVSLYSYGLLRLFIFTAQ